MEEEGEDTRTVLQREVYLANLAGGEDNFVEFLDHLPGGELAERAAVLARGAGRVLGRELLRNGDALAFAGPLQVHLGIMQG